MQWSAVVLDSLIGPKLSMLNSCNAPDVPQLPNYYGSLVLNQTFSPIYKDPAKVLLLNFVRRLRSATSAYRSGREHLLQYLAKLPDHSGIGDYNRALANFDDCIINGHIAIVCLNGLGKYLRRSEPTLPLVYIAEDGSDYDQLRKLNNRIKHFDEDIEKAVSNETADIPVAPVWITNDGLEASTASLSFVELADILTMQARDAQAFSEGFFTEAAERRKRSHLPKA